ncbi:MAG: hypothetical protein FD146_2500 [Anaerolineaceae bacterium]|nr:MAG: hypothetical protein FD146_2500 [Anaerolineaceae bacterium]
MYTAVRIQEKGQVTIPTDIRRKFSLKKGDLVTFVATDSGIVIKSLDQAADELLAGLEMELEQRNIPLKKVMERSMQKGGDAAVAEFGLSEGEKETLYQAVSLRAQSAVKAIRENARKYGTDKLTDEDIEAEIRAVRAGKP